MSEAYPLRLSINDRAYELDADPRLRLIDLLRDTLGLTGVRSGCDTAQCGACTVHQDGRAVRACAQLALQADGSAITTIEAVADGDGRLHPMQAAFHEHHGLQCGYCTPGMIMAALDLVKRDPDPDDAAIRKALKGNICRCTGYQNIVAAIQDGARKLRAGAGVEDAS